MHVKPDSVIPTFRPDSSERKRGSANMALKSYSCECGSHFQVSDREEDTTKCLICRVIDDLSTGKIRPPAAIQRPMDDPAIVGDGYAQ